MSTEKMTFRLNKITFSITKKTPLKEQSHQLLIITQNSEIIIILN